MNLPGVLDLELFFWSPGYNHGSSEEYYRIYRDLPSLLNRLRTEQTTIILTNDLVERIYNEIFSRFPTGKGSRVDVFGELKTLILSFLGAHKKYSFVHPLKTSLVSIRDIKKSHFDPEVKLEIDQILSEIHEENDGHFVFFSLGTIWPDDDDEIIVSEPGGIGVKLEVVLGNEECVLNEYFERKMNIFDEDYQKHLARKGYIIEGRRVSPLSCYRGRNVEKCQEMLDSAVSFGIRLYNKDCDNRVWVVFRRSFGGEPNYRGNNPYHGHDEADLNEIPPQVKLLENNPCSKA